MKTYPLRTFVRRVLLIRLGITTILIAGVIGAIAFFSQEARLKQQVGDYAKKGLEVISNEIKDVMSSRSLDAAGALRQIAVDGHKRSSTVYEAGRFVYVQFYDASLKLVTEWSLEGRKDIDRYKDFLHDDTKFRMKAGAATEDVSRINDTFIVLIVKPVTNEEGTVLAYCRGIFAVSEKTANEMNRALFFSVLSVIAIVFAVSAILYPVILHLMNRLADYSIKLLDANLETLSVMGSAIARRDSDTDAHNYRVTLYAVRIGEAIGLPESEMRILIKGSFLHDVGKLGIPDNILLKPDRLDEQEFHVMRTHVEKGADIVGRSSWLRDAAVVVSYHHEKFAGGGYTRNLSGGDIPVAARVFAIADVFDALTSKRPYKKALSFDAAMEIIEQGREYHFDPDISDAFRKRAADLYGRYAGHEGSELRQELNALVEKYFSAGIETLFYGK